VSPLKIATPPEGPLEPAAPTSFEITEKATGKKRTVVLPGTLPDYAPGYEHAPRDVRELPNYEKLTGFERWVMNKLPGFAESGVGKIMAKVGESWVGKALSYLDVGAEAVERVAGTAGQWLYEVPKTDDFDLASAWYAGGLSYDLANLPRIQDGRIIFPTDLPGIEGLVEARKQIRTLMDQGVDPGEALIQVRNDYYESQGALALRSQLHDAFFHVIADPLLIAARFVKPVEMANLRRAEILTKMAYPEVLVAARETAEATLRAAQESGDVAKIAEATSTIADIARVREIGPWEQTILRITGGVIGEERKGIAKFFDSKLWPFALTPEAKAHELAVVVADNVVARVIGQAPDSEAIVRSMQRIRDGIFSPELGHMILTPEGRYVKAVVTAMAGRAESLNEGYKLITFERLTMRNIAGVLGETEAKVMARLKAGEEVAVFTQYMEKLAELPDAQRLLQEALAIEQIAPDAWNAERLGAIAKTIGDAPYTDELFRATLNNLVADETAKLGIAMFGVKARGFLMKAADAMKSAETLAFLRLNPAYPIRNWINNEMTMIARGAMGSFSIRSAEEFAEKYGFIGPRMFGAAGPAALDETTGLVDDILGQAQSAIAREVKGKASWVDRMTDAIRGVNLGPFDFGKLSRRLEDKASFQAYTTYFERFWNRRKITKVADFDSNLANQLGREVTRALEGSVRSQTKEAGIDAAVLGERLNINSANVLEDASQRMGAQIDDIVSSEWTAAEMPGIVDAARKGERALQEHMASLEGRLQQHINAQMDEALKNLIDETYSRVQTEGPSGYANVLGDAMDEWYGAHQVHATQTSQMSQVIREIPDAKLQDAAWRKLFIREDAYYNRAWDRFEARVRGMTKAAREAKLPYADEVTKDFRQWRDGWQDLIKFRNKTLNDFFDARLKGKEYKLSWDQIVNEMDVRYRTMVDREDEIIGRVDDIVSGMLPVERQPLHRAWRDSVAAWRRQDKEAVADFYRRIANMTGDERSAAHNAFLKERQLSWTALANEETQGLRALAGDPEAAARYQARMAADQAARQAREEFLRQVVPEDRLDLMRQPVENQAQIDAISVRVARGEITKEQALQEIEALKALPREGIAGPPPSLPDSGTRVATTLSTPSVSQRSIRFGSGRSRSPNCLRNFRPGCGATSRSPRAR